MTKIINNPISGDVSFATVAVQVGDELWVGSSRGDRIARDPAAGLISTSATGAAPK